MVLFMAAFSFSLGPIIWLMIPELIDAKLISWVLVVHWVSSFTLLFLFPIVADDVLDGNPTLIFVFFALYLLVSVVVNNKVVIETKNKTEKMIREEYASLKVC